MQIYEINQNKGTWMTGFERGLNRLRPDFARQVLPVSSASGCTIDGFTISRTRIRLIRTDECALLIIIPVTAVRGIFSGQVILPPRALCTTGTGTTPSSCRCADARHHPCRCSSPAVLRTCTPATCCRKKSRPSWKRSFAVRSPVKYQCEEKGLS